MAMNLAAIQSWLIKELIIKDAETGTYGSSADRLLVINRGQNDFAMRAKLLPTYGDLTSAAEQQEYTITTTLTDFLKIDRQGGVLYDSKDLERTTIHKLKLRSGNSWRSLTSVADPTEYYLRSRYILGLNPKPSTASDTIRIYYFKRPTAMAADDSYPFDSITTFYDWHEAVCYYAAWKLLKNANRIEEAMYYRGEYFKELTECNAYWDSEDDEEDGFLPFVYRSR